MLHDFTTITLTVNKAQSCCFRDSIVATGGRYEDPKSVFKYEMCSYSPALFDSSLLPWQANKLALADAIWANTRPNQTAGPAGNVHFVLDGGTLLRHVSWPRGLTYMLFALCMSNA